ncbi:MAG: ABC transporter ATP-binding protein/permease [Anaerolineae bacterium]|nr:ABC transporter ATP-binding protein/permease [Anaerolineae bacterium]MCO5194230.1 ABC transporter ATP-binding protein/permease [Anaerolineae bacterium]
MTVFRRFRGRSADDDAKREPITRENVVTYRRLLQYVRPYAKWMVISILALIVSVALGLILPYAIGTLVDIVLVQNDRQLLNQLVIALFIIFIIQAIFSFIHRLTLAYVGENAVKDIRIQVYSHIQKLPLQFYADYRTGEVISRLTNDVAQLQTAITETLVGLLRQGLTLIGAAMLLFFLDWQLTLLILIGIPVITLTMVFLGRMIRRASRAVQDTLAEAANVVEETTAGIRIVKSFAREDYELERYSARVIDVFDAAMHRAKISATLGPIIGFMAFGAITVTLWFGSMQVLNGKLTAGDLVAYLVYTMMVATPIASIAGLYSQFQSALGATERVFGLLDTPSTIVEKPDAQPLPPVVGNVAFEKVSFKYNPNVAVLNDVSFSADSGQIIALVGPSGAGKSTLVNLIPRFYDVGEGAISIDDVDIRDVTLHSLREQIGIVPQETILFSDTVYANILYGKLDATRSEVEAAALAANAHDFIINDLPDGYETAVGERGVKLSGGQRQRVAIARAILKNPRILILDEATSSLDSESESLVQEALERLMQGRTSFVIAHRLSTVINADWVLVLENGVIVEQGTHADLLGSGDGLYRRLYDKQFRQGLAVEAATI